jgi:hypothetical protein
MKNVSSKKCDCDMLEIISSYLCEEDISGLMNGDNSPEFLNKLYEDIQKAFPKMKEDGVLEKLLPVDENDKDVNIKFISRVYLSDQRSF